MSVTEKQRQQQAELHKRLWSIANDLRGSMDASEFRNYILGLIFYRFLSEKAEQEAHEALSGEDVTYEEAWEDEDLKDALKEELLDSVGYFIEPQDLFSHMIKEIENQTFDIEHLSNAIRKVETSTLGQESEEDFVGLFSDMDLGSTRLGNTVKDRTNLIAKVMVHLSELPFVHSDMEIDMLGDAYEFLIGRFAANAGKKAGEFYTPQQVSKILAKIVTHGRDKLRNVYDPTCGSGSLLLRVGKEAEVYNYYGQERNNTTYNLARMNMLLHNVRYENFDIQNGDTLENPAFEGDQFEAVVANPPYSAKWSADSKFNDDERFSGYGKLAPKSKADFAFIQHMVHYLDDEGTMAVVLPHGVLFRGGAEETIRKYLIQEKNYLDAVIGLPANIFYGTGIPTCILVFKKCREADDDILFIDASNDFEKGKNQNNLTDENVEKIIETYTKRETVDKYSYNAKLEEIEENDYNLNIPRYVDTFEEEEPVDIDQVQKDLAQIDKEIAEVEEEINGYLKELGVYKHD
ncbi:MULTISPECIES: type I restriction-modification system subunit M [Staphylococcus]|uniref:site-specific DNA-methyltransferase (adenine-specific) n=1 Tax=Staphylococcus pettenkoferi TaxID=170573 RepID=A0A2N6QHK7_9STAP|nr:MULTISPECIES: type I restriction-modification system subunit M [Staphylococcus]MCI2791502.1 type I restriction-modification system subunit M [Staphylococcus pettenkoferi]MCY1567201.1 type I restriction-modification system subunit M [Staphylococcus pettenkoferi]MCY1588455.1 type I restriction-modification system subunit M [Staphylococcus pettenkoferi]OFK76683.1 restriction endonuclease subunit M [Staphylococcus sp. HMSC071G07]PMC19006.1 type I restriction-modification system subunit M [Staph